MVLVGDAYQLSPVKARGGMFEQLCADLPWSQRLGEVWRMADPEERDTSLALRAAHGNRLRTAVKWYRDHGRLHTGDPIAMAADALDAYLTDRHAGKDALLVCDTWEMADALNRRLHDTLDRTPGRPLTAARDQAVTVGDIIMSRSNDITITVHSGPNTARRPRRPSTQRQPVARCRNGCRTPTALRPNGYPTAHVWCSTVTTSNKHVTLGYAATVHSAQGVTADSCHAILGEGASRAMLYVAMTRGRYNNEAFLYQKFRRRGRSRARKTGVWRQRSTLLRRGNKYSAAHHFRTILANDDRPRTMHAEAERTEPHLLPEVVADLLQRHDTRRRARRTAWLSHVRTAEMWLAGHQLMAAAAERTSSVDLDAGGLEL